MELPAWDGYVKISGDNIIGEQIDYCNELLLEEYENKFQPAIDEFMFGFWSYARCNVSKIFR